MTEEDEKSGPDKRYKVLEVFGIPLEVSNPRLAELLTMDAKEALCEDLRTLGDAEEGEGAAGPIETAEVAPVEDFRSRIDEAGVKLGFKVEAGGVWKSPTGVIILVRLVDEAPELEHAKRYVGALAEAQEKLSGDSAGVFVVDGQVSCDIFKAAVRSRNLYTSIRVISGENLNRIVAWFQEGRIAHRQVVTLLVPLDNIDVGELVNVIGAATSLFES